MAYYDFKPEHVEQNAKWESTLKHIANGMVQESKTKDNMCLRVASVVIFGLAKLLGDKRGYAVSIPMIWSLAVNADQFSKAGACVRNIERKSGNVNDAGDKMSDIDVASFFKDHGIGGTGEAT